MDIGAKLVPIAILKSAAFNASLNATRLLLRSVAIVRRHEFEHGLPKQVGGAVTKNVFPRSIGVTDSPTLVDQKDAIRKTIG